MTIKVGDSVLFRLPRTMPGLLAQSTGEQRPATVLRVLDENTVNLHVLLDGANDTSSGALNAHVTACAKGNGENQWQAMGPALHVAPSPAAPANGNRATRRARR